MGQEAMKIRCETGWQNENVFAQFRFGGDIFVLNISMNLKI